VNPGLSDPLSHSAFHVTQDCDLSSFHGGESCLGRACLAIQWQDGMWKRAALIDHFKSQRPIIAPSMLKCDFGNLRRETELLDAACAPVLHLDVMDAHFVPNLSYGPMVIERMRSLTPTPFDAHLMVTDPASFLDDYVTAGCDAITIHLEAVPDPKELLSAIRQQDRIAGLAINPDTPFEAVEPFLSDCDLFLVMSVHPGFGGQSFIPDVVSKALRARQRCGDRLIVSIDGGINLDTIGRCAEAGVDLFVAGSAVFDAPDYSAAVSELCSAAANATVCL
jgi:ribulose-phosphate 3-epimerase